MLSSIQRFFLRPQTVPWVCFFVGVGVVAAHNYHVVGDFMLDDAFISFRYAENLVNGGGLTFNPGEERVEGYSNFLWVILMSGGYYFGVAPPLFSRILGGAFGIALLLLLSQAHRFIRRVSPIASGVAALFLATCSLFSPWPTSGMETVLFAFLILLIMLLHARSLEHPKNNLLLIGLGLCCALTAMTRPEGILFFVLITGDQFLQSLYRKDWGFLYIVIAFLLIFLPYFTWRFTYYGFPLPNTFYVKVGHSEAQLWRGVRYVTRFFWFSLGLSAPVFLALLFPPAWLMRHWRHYLLPATCLIYTAYIVSVGGDVMPAFRFFMPVIALICLLTGMSLEGLLRRPLLVVLFAALVIGYNGYQTFHCRDTHKRIVAGSTIRNHGTVVGKWMKGNLPPDSLLATNTAGTIPYYSGLRVIDTLGLNDVHIAHREIKSLGRGQPGHEKGDGAYVLSRKPDYIQFSSASGARQPRSFLGDQEVYRHPDFKKYYRFRTYRMPDGRLLQLYERIEPEEKAAESPKAAHKKSGLRPAHARP